MQLKITNILAIICQYASFHSYNWELLFFKYYVHFFGSFLIMNSSENNVSLFENANYHYTLTVDSGIVLLLLVRLPLVYEQYEFAQTRDLRVSFRAFISNY